MAGSLHQITQVASSIGTGLHTGINRAGSLFRGNHQAADRTLNFLYFVFNLVGGIGHTVGQSADFCRHHAETPTRFACAGGFESGIEGDQLGLIGDGVDDLHHFTDLFRFGSKFDNFLQTVLVSGTNVTHSRKQLLHRIGAFFAIFQSMVSYIYH